MMEVNKVRKSAKIGIVVAIIVAVIICSAVSLTRPKGSKLETRARNFVVFLKEGKFDKAYELFNEQMTEAMTVGQLEATWNGLIGEVGGYKDITGTRIATEAGYEVVYVTTEFEKTSLDVKVVFDEESKIAGLWFRPVGS